MLDDERGGKRDRLARFYRVVQVLEAHGDAGVSIEEIARRVGVSRRTVYRDLHALEDEIGVPVWNDGSGRWGVEGGGFLPPLKLTLPEAMAVVLSARLMARYADTYDPDLAAAFQKLREVLPATLADHVERTLRGMAERPRDERFDRHVHQLVRAWADRRIVDLTYAPGRYEGREAVPRRARVRPYLIEPSLVTHALYLIGHDESREALRTFKIERIVDLTVTAETFEPPEEAIEDRLPLAWDIIADQAPVEVVLRFRPTVAARVQEATWHPSQRVEAAEDGGIVWRAVVSGTIEVKLWILSWGDDVEVLEPPGLRDDVASTAARMAGLYADVRGGGAGSEPA